MRFLAFLLFACLSLSNAYSQCNPYFAYEKGDFFEQATFDYNGEESDRQRIAIKDISTEGNAAVYEVFATSASSMDEEGYELEFRCEEGTFRFDGQQLVESIVAEMESEGLSLTLEGESSSYPNALKVGDALEDNAFKMTMIGNMEGMTMDMVVTVLLTDRKVEEFTSITTEAGTFDCFKITYAMVSISEIMGMKSELTLRGIEYIAEKVGVVKSESFDQEGNLQSRSELTRSSLLD